MWKSAYVGVYQLLNWKMHCETLKFENRKDTGFFLIILNWIKQQDVTFKETDKENEEEEEEE